jgi:hypothetical protein
MDWNLESHYTPHLASELRALRKVPLKLPLPRFSFRNVDDVDRGAAGVAVCASSTTSPRFANSRVGPAPRRWCSKALALRSLVTTAQQQHQVTPTALLQAMEAASGLRQAMRSRSARVTGYWNGWPAA